jgi:hypothetical protein
MTSSTAHAFFPLNITGSPAAEEAFFGIFISFNSVYL